MSGGQDGSWDEYPPAVNPKATIREHPTCHDALCFHPRCREFQANREPGESVEEYLWRLAFAPEVAENRRKA